MFRVAAFVLISIAFVGVSGKSLCDPRVHGFYRFFAFESVLIVVLLNAPAWFHDAWSPRQILSWVLLLGSAILPAYGFHLLRTVGAPRGGVEDTTTLVTSGVYRYIRHPVYCSLLLLIWGAFLKRPSSLAGAVAAVGSLFTVATARVEERENLEKFGTEYQAYRSKTKMFIPFVV